MSVQRPWATLCFVFGLSLYFAADAQSLVLSAKGPSASRFSPGSILPANRRLDLKAGDRVEILVGGTSKVLWGPAQISADQIDAASKRNLGTLFKRAPADVAAVRSMEIGAEPTLWQADTFRPDNATTANEPIDFCLLRDQAPVFWRRNAMRDSKVTMTDVTETSSWTVNWPAGDHGLIWPASIPIKQSHDYDISSFEIAKSRWRWHGIKSDPGSLIELTSALIDRKCFLQANTLRRKLGITSE